MLERHKALYGNSRFFWYSVPALLKHWQDEVLTPIYKEQIFKDKAFGVVTTMGGSKKDYEGSNASIKELLKPMYYGF
ncbi:NAD(P)H-dependent oxidoreductase [Helicobacter pullorum]